MNGRLSKEVVIPAKAGIQEALKTLDSGLRIAGMTNIETDFVDRH